MKIFAIGDLHLSFENKINTGEWDQVKEYKPMDCFGEKWDKHYKKIYVNWHKKINNRNLVLIPGDISWAQKLEEANSDINFISQLPGKKVLIKGNHDYWWHSIKRLREQLPADMWVIQNDSINYCGVTIAGTRGWLSPGGEDFSEHDQKIFRREKLRLKMSLDSIEKREKKLIVMLHYMPTNIKHKKNEIIELLISYNVDLCIYGHLHGEDSHQKRLPEKKWGINFQLVSADFLNFSPVLVSDLNNN